MSALVVFSLESWDAVWRRNQYLIDGLLRDDPQLRVLFVEPPRDPLHDLRRGGGMRRGAGLRVADGYGGRLRLLQPTKWLPRVAGPLADVLLWSSVRKALRASDMTSGVLWVNDPAWALAVARLDWPALYDMTDDWLSAERSSREHARLVDNEGLLMARCRRVVVCSPGLLASRRDRRPDAVLIPNAVDVARYRDPVARPADAPGRPYALYVGTLHEDRLDVDLVVRTGEALAAEGSELVLIGPDALGPEASARLAAARGVSVRGPRPFDQVPAYLQHAAVLVVPHAVSAFTDSLDPLKAYEYLAVGRPIVSTAVAGFRELAGAPGVRIAPAVAFGDEVARTVSRAPEGAFDHDVPDWSERVAAFRAVIGGIEPGGAHE